MSHTDTPPSVTYSRDPHPATLFPCTAHSPSLLTIPIATGDPPRMSTLYTMAYYCVLAVILFIPILALIVRTLED